LPSSSVASERATSGGGGSASGSLSPKVERSPFVGEGWLENIKILKSEIFVKDVEGCTSAGRILRLVSQVSPSSRALSG
jgi:hypothetical protein